MARPTDYLAEYCARVVEMGKDGMGPTEMAAELGVARSTIYEWEGVHPEFSDALTQARTNCQAWWERQGRLGLVTQGFNASLWAKNVSCRFRDDWTDTSKQELSGPGGSALFPQTVELVFTDKA